MLLAGLTRQVLCARHNFGQAKLAGHKWPATCLRRQAMSQQIQVAMDHLTDMITRASASSSAGPSSGAAAAAAAPQKQQAVRQQAASQQNGTAAAAAPAGKQKLGKGSKEGAKGGAAGKKGQEQQGKTAKAPKQPPPVRPSVIRAADPGCPLPRGAQGSVPSIRTELAAAFQQALATAFPLAEVPPAIAATAERDARFGDYQCNNAMALFGMLRGKEPYFGGSALASISMLTRANPGCKLAVLLDFPWMRPASEGAPKNPRAAGEALVAALPQLDCLAGTPELAGPGFINLRLSDEWLGRRVTSMLQDGIQTWAPRLTRSRPVVDFSSPNVAKEMHVGHLRSTIIGDTIGRALEFCGADVVRLNHVGDWGTQFGMLIEFLADDRPGGLGDPSIENMDIMELQTMYKKAKQRFDNEDDFKERARAGVGRLQGGDPEYLAAWQRICEASRKAFQKIYDRLGVQLTERGESFYNPLLAGLVKELREAGVAEESDGAMIIPMKEGQVPLMIQKRDGAFGYDSTDMAAIRQRLHEERGDWLIYVTDSGQAGHFAAIFEGARRAGFLPPASDPSSPLLDHVGFGVVLGEDGKRMKTRAGESASSRKLVKVLPSSASAVQSIRLAQLLDEAKDRCRTTIKQRREEKGDAIEEAELEATAAAMGYGSVKYADLKNNRQTDYTFSFDDMLSLQGNTAVYLLYAHARLAAIGRKAGIEDVCALAKDNQIIVAHENERELALHVARFPEALEGMLEELLPNRITDYLYNLSDKFNGFYQNCKVVGDQQQTSRLLLCEATAIVMRQCLSLLGITPLYRI